MQDMLKVAYATDGSSSKLDELGMREMQRRVYDQRNSQYLLVKSPPASGKSRALMYISLDKLENQGVDKVVVAVPERSIGASFKSAALTETGFPQDWVVKDEWNLCTPGQNKIGAFKRFLASDDKVLLCTHSTLRNAYDQIGAEAFSNFLVAVDEFHHASADVESRLGELVRGLIAQGDVHIVAMTGSYFRGDTTPVLRPEDEERFTRVTYTYYEQLNGYRYLRTLGVGYHFYKRRYLSAIGEVLDTKLKTIVHIPSIASGESTKDKYEEVGQIFDVIGEVVGVDPITGFYRVRTQDGRVLKIADLVDDGPDREKVMAALRNVTGRDDLDMVIALGMAKEGFDWPHCEHALTVGYRGSLTEVIQIIGRCTRDAEGKSHAKFTNLIAEPDAETGPVKEAVNNMLKAIACSLLMEQVLAPNFKFRTRADDELDGSAKPEVKKTQTTGDGPTIEIKGFKEPSSARVKEILVGDLNDLKAAILQDGKVMKATLTPEEHVPEVVNKVLIPNIITERYPDLTPEQVEEVRQHVIADAAFKASGGKEKDAEGLGGDRFVNLAGKLVRVADLHVDLIDSVNPFQLAYEVISKSVSADVLKRIHEAIVSIRIPITDEELLILYPRIQAFKAEKGREPELTATDPRERRYAEALALLRKKKRERDAARATEAASA